MLPNAFGQHGVTKPSPSRSAHQNAATEFPRVPTQQASLPVELQLLSTEQVYPNQETSVTLEEKRIKEKSSATNDEPNSQVTNDEAAVKKRIVWNTNAPSNPFATTHCYTKEPGAWYLNLLISTFLIIRTCSSRDIHKSCAQ